MNYIFSVLKNLIERCVLGVSALELCKIGDDMIVQETDKVYKKEKEIQKGIAFPTQANINNCICHYAPLSSVGSNGEFFRNRALKCHLETSISNGIEIRNRCQVYIYIFRLYRQGKRYCQIGFGCSY